MLPFVLLGSKNITSCATEPANVLPALQSSFTMLIHHA
jgi:hypothetical protein